MPLLCRCHYLDTVLAGIVQLSLARVSEVAVATCCYYSPGFWKGASASLNSRIPDHRRLTTLEVSSCHPPLSCQTFLDKPRMWLWPLYQFLFPSLGSGIHFSSKGFRPEELTIDTGCIAWMERFWRHRRCPKPKLKPAVTSAPCYMKEAN